ncbi:hypothetical protein [Actinoplanes sp. TFC3]|uniref:hypothetical protein n=1 Tax=Actinoplanes sp. TFC3 TaxID=1710355 RepID=UPI000A803883|nr:hypothetical protein [Actinoplanes sp. TFC3]
MATLIGTGGATIWLVAVLLVLVSGLTAALISAVRSNAAPASAERRTPQRRPTA